MSHVVRDYLFKGCQIPQKFMNAVYSPSWDARNMRFQGTDQADYGESIAVRVSADSSETLDWFLGEWTNWKEVK
ncbi:hypothetical protein [Salmonella phage SSBI34]|nr:hypothetical protein [Salmonella phage SSBI34]